MNTPPRQIKSSIAITAGLAAILILNIGCKPTIVERQSEPSTKVDAEGQGEAETFADNWRQAMTELRTFRELTAETAPNARQLAASRDSVRRRFEALRSTTQNSAENTFVQSTSGGLSAILLQLDNAVQAAEQGQPEQARDAAREAGLILEEIASLLKLTDL